MARDRGTQERTCSCDRCDGKRQIHYHRRLDQYINRFRKTRIITLEDPVEFIYQSEESMVSQRQVGQNVMTFSGGLRSALRENPDIIFVGEIRGRGDCFPRPQRRRNRTPRVFHLAHSRRQGSPQPNRRYVPRRADEKPLPAAFFQPVVGP